MYLEFHMRLRLDIMLGLKMRLRSDIFFGLDISLLLGVEHEAEV